LEAALAPLSGLPRWRNQDAHREHRWLLSAVYFT
jgi:hypothetical protein